MLSSFGNFEQILELTRCGNGVLRTKSAWSLTLLVCRHLRDTSSNHHLLSTGIIAIMQDTVLEVQLGKRSICLDNCDESIINKLRDLISILYHCAIQNGNFDKTILVESTNLQESLNTLFNF